MEVQIGDREYGRIYQNSQIKKYIKDNYIPKKVIRNKIKELEKTLQTDNISQYLETIAQTKALYELLQKDMEEDNYNHIPRID